MDVIEDVKRMLGAGQDERKYLDFPLFVGKKWDAAWSWHDPGTGRTIRMTGTASVAGMEEVNTAAGNFRAYKIERRDTGSSGGPQPLTIQWDFTYYYSPQVRAIVTFHLENLSMKEALGAEKDIQLIKVGAAR